MRDDWTALVSALAGFLGPETTTRALAALAFHEEPTHRHLVLAGLVLRSQGWSTRRLGHKGPRTRIYSRPTEARAA